MGNLHKRCNDSTGKMSSGEGVPSPKTSPSGGREESVPEESWTREV